ncbi:MAG: type III PLP-dependent enzyme [Rubrimonas sp.]|uniref:type III PLP-dependent enzyme n=1 Tax=Rubrimonas sp. TaxID=2036015 RepID=UPI002FDE9A89
MSTTAPIWRTPEAYLAAERPDAPVLFFAPSALERTARRFLAGFPGLTTYAVKANSEPAVLLSLIAAGVRGFDVASPDEIALIHRLAPDAAMHYHNPAKARDEIAFALAHGVRTFSFDSHVELAKLAEMTQGLQIEASVRFRLPVAGAAYDFGSKFGADPEKAAALLAEAAALGMTPSLTFHPGTQCETSFAWVSYIRRAAEIAEMAGVRIARLNVGGGFPAALYGDHFDLEGFFAAIEGATREAFGDDAPALVCEPGRGMVADSMALAAKVKLVREDGAVFLNDGIYGGLDEFPVLGQTHSFRALKADGTAHDGPTRPAVLFGPTCDSLDRLPGQPDVPAALAEGDWLVFDAMGAYGSVTATRFNGYGALRTAVVASL